MITIQEMVAHNEANRAGRRESAWYKAERRAEREAQWIKDNDRTFQRFCQLTRQAIQAARLRGETPRVGAKAVAERIRWDSITRTDRDDEGYVVNNTYVTAMAREFVRLNPHFRNVFEFRK